MTYGYPMPDSWEQEQEWRALQKTLPPRLLVIRQLLHPGSSRTKINGRAFRFPTTTITPNPIAP